jgi:hypothetical protein
MGDQDSTVFILTYGQKQASHYLMFWMDAPVFISPLIIVDFEAMDIYFFLSSSRMLALGPLLRPPGPTTTLTKRLT